MADAPVLSQSLIVTMSDKFGIEAEKFVSVVKRTIMPEGSSNEEMAAFLMVANEHGFNPFTREIYAFKAQGGKIVPVVSVDGWIKKINEKPDYQGLDLEPGADSDDGKFIDCTIHRSGRRPTTIREYLKECYRDTGPWKSHTNRMLRHKAIIQCARVAYGFAGIYDPDEAERFAESGAPAATLVTRTQEKQKELREKLQPKQLAEGAVIDMDPLPMATEEPEKVEVKPKDTKKAKAKAEKPAEASPEDVKWAMELAKSRESVFEMVNAMPLADRTAWLEQYGLTDVAQINEFNLEQCDELLGR